MPQIDTDKTMFSRGFSRSETDFMIEPAVRSVQFIRAHPWKSAAKNMVSCTFKYIALNRC